MLRTKLLNKLGISVVSLFLINTISTFLHLPSLMWWFDMPLHFLGGLSVFYFCAIIWLPARQKVSNGRYVYEAVITTVFIGVLWEALELFLYLHYGSPDFILLDSFSDVFFDLSGALFAAYMTVPLLAAALPRIPVSAE